MSKYSRALMEAALEAGVERVVYTSSVATLGTTGSDAAADEETPSRLADMVGGAGRVGARRPGTQARPAQ